MCLINPLPRRHYTENHDRALRFLEKYFPELERGRTIQGGDRIETTFRIKDKADDDVLLYVTTRYNHTNDTSHTAGQLGWQDSYGHERRKGEYDLDGIVRLPWPSRESNPDWQYASYLASDDESRVLPEGIHGEGVYGLMMSLAWRLERGLKAKDD